MSTRYVTPPEGDFNLMLDSRNLDVTKWFTSGIAQKGQNAGNEYVTFEIPMEILDDKVRQALNQDHVYSRYKGFLDFAPDGSLDFSEGKNVKIGRLREALNQNDPNVPWDPSQLALASGTIFKGHLKHTPNKDDPTAPFSEISRVTKA